MKNDRRPKLGQHFLIDESVVERIIQSAQLPIDAQVVEIGPGKGILTRALNAAVPDGEVLAIEFDRDLIDFLREHTSKRVKVIHRDALLFDYAEVKSPYHVVSNLPYQITSPILHRLIGSSNPPATMTLMMQREVADRIVALPHTRERGLLTVVVEWYGSVEQVFDVGPEAFSPRPKVWSSVVRLVRADDDRPPFQPFVNFLKIGFSQKRRQIHHPLTAAFPDFRPQLDGILALVGVERTMRAEELSFDQWVRLFNQISRRLKSDS